MIKQTIYRILLINYVNNLRMISKNLTKNYKRWNALPLRWHTKMVNLEIVSRILRGAVWMNLLRELKSDVTRSRKWIFNLEFK